MENKDTILSEAQMRAAVLHCQGVMQKEICQELGISQKTFWNWKESEAFKEAERAYSKAAWDTAINGLKEIGAVSAGKLLKYLRTSDEQDETARKLYVDTMKLLLAMGKNVTVADIEGKKEKKVTLTGMLQDITGNQVDVSQ